MTYAQVIAWSEQLALGLLRQLSVRSRDVIAVLSPNSLEWPLLSFGVMLIGGTISGINPTYTVNEVVHQLRDCQARVLFASSAMEKLARDACSLLASRTGAVVRVVLIDSPQFLNLLNEYGTLPPAALDFRRDPAALPYSSGTTGLSKGVILSHYNLVANLEQMAAADPLSAGGGSCAVLPFFHVYGFVVVMMRMVAAGKPVVVFPRFELQLLLRNVQQHKLDHLPLVPPIVLALVKHPEVSQYDLSSVKSVFSGAAPLGEDLASDCAKRLGCEVKQGYGMTELSPVSHLPPNNSRPGSVGVLMPNMEALVVDTQTGVPVRSRSQEGELWLRGPNVMQGYLNNRKATEETIDAEGFLHTGDVAVLDDDGWFYIVDRVKELIKVKGLQVAPAELEAILQSHPAVADAAVVPLPDVAHGEVPKAWVVRKPNVSPPVTAEQLMEFVHTRVAPHKRIRVVQFIDAIPKTASGKILRKDLRAREQQQQQQQQQKQHQQHQAKL